MLGRTHLIAGAVAGTLLTSQPNMAVVVIATLGALLPDLDHPKSIISRQAGVAALPVHLLMTHRGILHSGILLALLVALAFTVPDPSRLYALALVAGWASHLLLDALTVAGIPLFYPVRHRFTLLPIHTGGLLEALVGLILLGLLAIRVAQWL